MVASFWVQRALSKIEELKGKLRNIDQIHFILMDPRDISQLQVSRKSAHGSQRRDIKTRKSDVNDKRIFWRWRA